MNQDELLKDRPDLLLLALKIMLNSHTSHPADSIQMILPAMPPDVAAFQQRDLTIEPVDGGLKLTLAPADVVPVVARFENGGWLVTADGKENKLSGVLSPFDVQQWCKVNIAAASEVEFRR